MSCRRLRVAVLVSSALFLSACASSPKLHGAGQETRTQSPGQRSTPGARVEGTNPEAPWPAPFGIPADATGQASPSPSPVPIRGSYLIFGPGLARAWAAVGVIEAFEAAREPIVGVAGIEAGALVAAAYARSGSASRLRWDLMSVSPKLFYDPPRFGFRWLEKPVAVEPLAKALQKLFGDALTEAQRVPLRIAGRNVRQEGVLAQRVLESFWNPVLFDPRDPAWSGESFDPRDSWMQLVEGIRAEAEATVWIFDWLDGSSTPPQAAGSHEVRYAESVRALLQAFRPPLSFGPNFRWVRVDLGSMKYLDFDKRGDATFRGKVAARNALTEWIRTRSEAPAPGP